MASVIEHFLSSELSRNSAQVFSAAEIKPVLVTRRDGENLVLMTEREANAQRELFEFAAQLIAVTTSSDGNLENRMADLFPWMHALDANDKSTCTREIINAARASFSTGKAHLAISELNSWKETATAIAEGLDKAPVDWLEKPTLATKP